MGKKSGPAAPAPPDPYKTADAQSQYNKEAAIWQANLNRINQYTPEGSLTYSFEGYNDDGTPRYSQTQTYSAAEQAKYDQQNQVANALNGIAVSNIDRVREAQATPFSYDGMQQLQGTYGQNNPFQLQGGPQAQMGQTSVYAGPIQQYLQQYGVQNSAGVGSVQHGAAGAGTAQAIGTGAATQGIQQGLDYSGLGTLPGYNDYGAEGQRMADSVYKQAASRLDPRFKAIEDEQRARLAAQGITENSEAYRRDLDNTSRDRNDAYNQAIYSSIGAGANEQSRLFGLAMGARQQGQNEINAQGQFRNAAQAQGFGQSLAAYAQAMQAQGQNFGQNFQNAGMYNAAEQQQYGQRLSEAELYNRAQGQLFGQGATAADFANQAQQQQFGQGMENADLYNQQIQQYFNQGQAATAFNNNAQNQWYNQDAARAAFENNARQQQIQEAAYLRNVPLNDISVLLNGNSPTAPAFNQFAQVGVAAPDYQGAVQNNYNAAIEQYKAKQAARSQGLGSIFGALGSIGASAATGGLSNIFSDRRLKEDIKRIGTLANGIPTYAFKYIGDKFQRFGVMAQEVLEVIPDAVGYDKDGFMYVDYGKVY